MRPRTLIHACLSVALTATAAIAQQATPPAGANAAQTPRRGPRPYNQVITDKAVTDRGGITTHEVEGRHFFEVPDSLVGRDQLMVTRIAAVPANFSGFTSAGTSLAERVVRWERQGDRVLLRVVRFNAVADDTLPIALSVAVNNLGAILASFPVQAFTGDSASTVIDVTDFFAGDTPAISGLGSSERRTYQVRRLDPARSIINTVRSFPLNVEIRHTQTFDAGAPPSDPETGTITVEMRQSLIVLPREPMRPRYADQRIGFFSVSRVNYGLDEQKAASQEFIRRWRLEPKDPAAYARGELVEPVKPIVYYLDPATPAKWRSYMRQGVEDWQRAFEKAGFKNAIIAKDAPTKSEDPEWDPEDIRYSVVRWVASLVRNAVGPSTSDPRSGEIIESDITWYHNHMRSYRNRLLIETAAANPAARTLNMPDELMGETMRKVITHEVGHALGLPHNMIASASFPVDSLRSASFTRQYGVSATIMDYARQNYVAQPGDGLEPRDFVRRLGPFDDFIINWGYRVIPQAQTPEAERPILNRWITEQSGPMAYRYLPQFAVGIDPRAQTEDIGDDPIRASTYALANMRRVIPNLVAWTTKSGEDFTELSEIYSESLGMWSLYMGHVTNLIGGMSIDLKSADQSGAVYGVVPRARQQAALKFLSDNAFTTPHWLTHADIVSRIGPSSLAPRQANVLSQLLDARRLGRLESAGVVDAGAAYPLPQYLEELRQAVWTGATPDANRRSLQRVYLERLEALMNPPAATAGGGPGGGQGANLPPILQPPNVRRSDMPALARASLRSIKADARRWSAGPSPASMRPHWQDISDRVDAILEKDKQR